MILVYALAPRGVRVSPPFRTIAVGSLSAIVRTVRRPPAATPAAMRAHHRALTALAGRVPALLPVRFATTFGNLDELQFVLRERQPTLRRALALVRGRVQIIVRFVPGAPSPKPEAPRTSGTAYLKGRAAVHAVPEFEPVRAAVRRWVKGERVENQNRVASVYHLVPRGSVAAYRRALLAAADEHGVRLLVTGPFPPYAFASPF